MKGTIKAASPRMKDGVQRSWTGGNGTLWYYNVTIEDENGGIHTGEVAAKSEGTYRFGPGDQVEFTETKGDFGFKFKIDRPKDGQAAGAPSRPTTTYKQQASGGGNNGEWSPEKQNSVMIQGLLKHIIGSSIKSDMWGAALRAALKVHDEVLAERLPKKEPVVEAAKPKLEYHPDGHPDLPKPVHQGVIGGKGIGDEDEEAPF